MQVGIDVGATKIESVVLEDDGQEKHRSRISCPKDYTKILKTIRKQEKIVVYGSRVLNKKRYSNGFVYSN